MGKFIDMTGWVMSEHGVPESKLTVIRRVENDDRGCAQWLCECACADHNQIVAKGWNLRGGHTKSCGCLNIEKASTIHNKYNKYDLSGEYGVGWTSNTNREFYFDLEDYDKIKDFCWHESVVGDGFHCLRAYNPQTKKHIRMHVLLGFKGYDHIDRNELNNLKSNLRQCTHQENIRNSSIQKK